MLHYVQLYTIIIIIITRTASHTTKYIHQRDSPMVRLLGGEGTIPKSTQYVTVVTVVVCDIRIFISILYRYNIGVNIEILIRFSIIFNCVGGVIAWAADIYKYA